jgi:adenylate cyclase
MERRLAAIMAADIAGYSRLMGEDESGTLDALKLHLKELIDPEIGRNKGRVVKLMGDGILAEFPSAVNALLCAVEIQRGLGERNMGIPKTRQILYRIGINVGDVIVDGNDIYGDGVNIASRLEALATPGMIYLSGSVYDQVKKKVRQSFEDLGKQSVKNIAEPVRVYRVLTEPGDGPVGKRLRWISKNGFAGATAGVLTLFFVIGALVLWQQASDIAPPAERGAKPLAPTKSASQAEATSIAVLPFANKSKMADQAFFAGGVTDDLITELTKIKGLLITPTFPLPV